MLFLAPAQLEGSSNRQDYFSKCLASPFSFRARIQTSNTTLDACSMDVNKTALLIREVSEMKFLSFTYVFKVTNNFFLIPFFWLSMRLDFFLVHVLCAQRFVLHSVVFRSKLDAEWSEKPGVAVCLRTNRTRMEVKRCINARGPRSCQYHITSGLPFSASCFLFLHSLLFSVGDVSGDVSFLFRILCCLSSSQVPHAIIRGKTFFCCAILAMCEEKFELLAYDVNELFYL